MRGAVAGFKHGVAAGLFKRCAVVQSVARRIRRPARYHPVVRIELALKKQQAGRHFAEAAETFSNTVYEQSDSLKPAADKFKLAIQQAQGVTRQGTSVPALNNARLLSALKSWRVLEPVRRGRAEAALQRVAGETSLSRDVSDIVQRALATV